MILLLDTSMPTCYLSLIDGSERTDTSWEAGRTLAKGLLGYLHEQLNAHDKTWTDISAIGVYKGPGSFTGLRIGLTVMNTLADTLGIPIVGTTGNNWQVDARARLDAGETDHLVMPFYGADAHITKPRK